MTTTLTSSTKRKPRPFGYRQSVSKSPGVKAPDPKKIRRQLKGGADLYDFPIEKLRPRQARRLADMFVRLGGKLER